MDKLTLAERPNPLHHKPGGTHWVCWNREWSLVTYGDTRDEACFIAGVAEGVLTQARREHGQPTSKPESEWITVEEARDILEGVGSTDEMLRGLLESFEATELGSGKTIEQIREEHGLPEPGR